MPDRLDNTVISDRPDVKRRSRFESGEAMIAVNFSGFAVDSNYLASCYMTLDAMQRYRTTLLDHLHPSTDTKHG
jgi:hypothetical protein